MENLEDRWKIQFGFPMQHTHVDFVVIHPMYSLSEAIGQKTVHVHPGLYKCFSEGFLRTIHCLYRPQYRIHGKNYRSIPNERYLLILFPKFALM